MWDIAENKSIKLHQKKEQSSKMNHNLAIGVCEGLSLIGPLESFL